MYALVEYKGKQYKAEKGALLRVDKIDAEKGSKIDIDYVSGAKVQVPVEDSFKDKKVLVFKYKSKKDYHRLHGHRQQYTNIRVDEIIA